MRITLYVALAVFAAFMAFKGCAYGKGFESIPCSLIEERGERVYCIIKPALLDLYSRRTMLQLQAMANPEWFKREFEKEDSELRKEYFALYEEMVVLLQSAGKLCHSEDQAKAEKCYESVENLFRGLAPEVQELMETPDE